MSYFCLALRMALSENMTNKMVTTALRYKNKYGFSVIPTNGKVSMVKWSRYQKRLPTDDEIKNWWTNEPTANIAVVTGQVSGNICAIDVDSYKDEAVFEAINSLIPEALEFPISTTPRGGQHWWFRSDKELGDKIAFLEGVDFRSSGIIILPPSEGYNWKVKLKDVSIPMLPQSIIDKLLSTKYTKHTKYKESTGHYFTEGRRDNDLFSLANGLVKLCFDTEFITEVLTRVIHTWGENDPEWVQKKIESALKRHGHDNLASEIKEWVSVTEGVINVAECDRELQIVTKRDKANRRQVFGRLVKEGIIERVGKKNGQFRRVQSDLELMNWQNADVNDYYDLKMPLGLHNDMNTFPGNVIVIAGTPNAGKSAFVLNIAKMNNDKEISYFNSEMGAEELKTRLMLFDDVDLDAWGHIKFYNRNGSFSDVIEPDALNIIDFLEITNEFWLIAEEIRKIHDKLDKGVAIICMQKKKGAEYGRGGEFSLEKPRLYISLDFQKLKVIKCKNPKAGLNINGKEIGFKLLHGSTFIHDNNLINPHG